MAAIALRKDEKLGLGVAVAAHVVLLALLVLQPPRTAEFPLPERMTVTLSDDVALQAMSPEPMAAPAPDMAPELGEAPPEPAPLAPPESAMQGQGKGPAQSTKTPPKPPAAAKTPPKGSPGASKIGDDFLKGIPATGATGTAKNPPAAVAGPAVKSALLGAVSRELKPRWAAPQGADVDKLVTFVTFSLNPDGSLAGAPKAVRQEGINPTNRAQASRHAEQAVRAVQLAAPFELPAEYYETWKRIVEFRFDRKLSQ